MTDLLKRNHRYLYFSKTKAERVTNPIAGLRYLRYDWSVKPTVKEPIKKQCPASAEIPYTELSEMN